MKFTSIRCEIPVFSKDFEVFEEEEVREVFSQPRSKTKYPANRVRLAEIPE